MCGRFTLRTPIKKVAELFDVGALDERAAREPARFNIAPTQTVAAIRAGASGRELAWLAWNFVPTWGASEPHSQRSMPGPKRWPPSRRFARRFASAAVSCRPMDSTNGTAKGACDNRISFTLATIGHSRWPPCGSDRRTARRPNSARSSPPRPTRPCARCTIGCRSSCVREQIDTWLDPAIDEPDLLVPLLVPCGADDLVLLCVGRRVNSAQNEGPECIAPAPREQQQGRLFDET